MAHIAWTDDDVRLAGGSEGEQLLRGFVGCAVALVLERPTVETLERLENTVRQLLLLCIGKHVHPRCDAPRPRHRVDHVRVRNRLRDHRQLEGLFQVGRIRARARHHVRTMLADESGVVDAARRHGLDDDDLRLALVLGQHRVDQLAELAIADQQYARPAAHAIASRAASVSSRLTTSAYLACMSWRFARWASALRSPTASRGTHTQ